MLLIIMRLKRVLRERWISNIGGVLTYIACSLPLLLVPWRSRLHSRSAA